MQARSFVTPIDTTLWGGVPRTKAVGARGLATPLTVPSSLCLPGPCLASVDPTFDRIISISLLHVMQADFLPESNAG